MIRQHLTEWQDRQLYVITSWIIRSCKPEHLETTFWIDLNSCLYCSDVSAAIWKLVSSNPNLQANTHSFQFSMTLSSHTSFRVTSGLQLYWFCLFIYLWLLQIPKNPATLTSLCRLSRSNWELSHSFLWSPLKLFHDNTHCWHRVPQQHYRIHYDLPNGKGQPMWRHSSNSVNASCYFTFQGIQV